MRLIANISMLFTEYPLLERIELAKQAGFTGVEIQFPYELSALDLKAALDACDMLLHLINFPAGDLMMGGLGYACQAKLTSEFAEAMDTALEYCSITKPKMINVLAGRITAEQDRNEALSTLAGNLREASRAFAKQHMTILCEAINPFDMPGYLINTPEHLLELLKEVARPNCLAQLDFYHMARQQLNPNMAIETLAGQIGHIQFADCPGRHEPGTGDIDFLNVRHTLQAIDYQGCWAAEYHPSTTTLDSLAWMTEPAFEHTAR